MLVLSRKNRESVVVNGTDGFDRMIIVTVLDIKRGKVQLGFEADADVPVHRMEVWERGRAKSSTPDPKLLAGRPKEPVPNIVEMPKVQ